MKAIADSGVTFCGVSAAADPAEPMAAAVESRAIARAIAQRWWREGTVLFLMRPPGAFSCRGRAGRRVGRPFSPDGSRMPGFPPGRSPLAKVDRPDGIPTGSHQNDLNGLSANSHGGVGWNKDGPGHPSGIGLRST